MGRYVTLAQYYLAEDSIPGLLTIPANIITRTIIRAEALIDAYVGFDTRYGGFEPHSGWIQQAFDEKTLRVSVPNFPVPVRSIDRYRIQVSNMTSTGDGFFAEISPGDCVINVFGGYIEIVPLQAVTYSLTPFMLGLGLRPPLVVLDYESGFYIPSFGEVLENTNGDLTTYRAQRGFWATSYTVAPHLKPLQLPPVPSVVYVNGVVQNSGAYTSDTTEGVVTFTGALAPGSTVTCDYTYTIPDPIREATIMQVTSMLAQRNLNLQGLGGIEVARSRDQQIKRHIRTSSGSSAKDEPAIDPGAMQLLEPYTYIPIG